MKKLVKVEEVEGEGLIGLHQQGEEAVNVYVAGKFEEKDRVREIQAALRAAGNQITHDWTPGDAAGKSGPVLDAYLRRCAEAAEQGVYEADVVVFLANDACRGGFVEVGMALGRGIPVVSIGRTGCIFHALGAVMHAETVEEAVRAVALCAAITPLVTIDDYQKAALRTAKNPALSRELHLANRGLGIAGEAGEVADLLKKHLTHGHPLDVPKLLKEVGDVLWYLAVLANDVGATLSTVAELNIEKLKARYPAGFSTEQSINRAEEP